MIEGKSDTDPRLDEPVAVDAGIAPVVALPRRGLPTPVLIALAAAAAVILFLYLESRRLTAVDEPAFQVAQNTPLPPPPPLYLPASAPPQQLWQPSTTVQGAAAPTPTFRAVPAAATSYAPPPVYVPAPQSVMPSMNPPNMPPYAQAPASGPALVIDMTVAPSGRGGAESAGSPETTAGTGNAGTRVRAGLIGNRSTTVPQGTLIPAVLETGFDSTGPGFARAIVSRDVRGFDGSHVLIPRGSRLIGEYRAGASVGQGRAMINWSRLVRPDGVIIAIGSPAADSVGRGGIKARVNTHFLQQLGSVLLQSVVDIGTGLATRRAESVVVAVPQGGRGTSGLALPQPTPTLTVRPGKSISVFVSRDLDFAGMVGAP